MSAGRLRRALLCSFLATATCVRAETTPDQKLAQQFQSAVVHYQAGQLSDAAAQLEDLLPKTPKSYQVRELLGLVYARQSLDAKAAEQLEIAVQLKPGSATARTNFAAALVRTGKTTLAAEQLQKALALDPQNYDANHNLGEIYVQSGKIATAIPYLEEAQRIHPDSYGNGYDLALAWSMTGKLAQGRELVQSLEKQKDTGELHNLLGQIDEKDGKYVVAANEFETAAHMDASEENLFAWGSEYLLHRTYDPAIEVFQQGVERYPNSPRLRIGLGMALYSRGKYDEAVKALLAAADLDPSDPRCYLFLSKAYDSSPNQADDVIQRFRRYEELQPNNAMAAYYYAMSLWKGKRAEDAGFEQKQILALLQKSVTLDPGFPDAHVQLGNLYADQHDYAKSVPEYERALELNSNLPDAHYRLGQDYVHLGQKDRAQAEFDVYQKLRAQHLADVDKERAEVQQFVYSAKPGPVTKP